jgi:hypothetical protein
MLFSKGGSSRQRRKFPHKATIWLVKCGTSRNTSCDSWGAQEGKTLVIRLLKHNRQDKTCSISRCRDGTARSLLRPVENDAGGLTNADDDFVLDAMVAEPV